MKNTIERALEKQRQLDAQSERDQLFNSAPEQTTALNGVNPNSVNPEMSSPIELAHSPHLNTTASALSHNKVRQSETNTEKSQIKQIQDSKSVFNIDIKRLDEMGMVTPTEAFSSIKEEYRYIKRPLLNNAFGDLSSSLKHPNLIMVSSSFPGEGKTFTAINLAISIAMEQDRKVMLIDADVINPNVCNRLGLSERTGLLNYLKGEASVQDIISDTNIPNLKLITAGNRSHQSNELLASAKMANLMSELSTRYKDRICIFDTSPILGASETNVLSQMTGQGVIVVEEERTTHGQLERSLSLLNPEMAVGLVLNKSKKSRKEYYGYYYANSK
ncbi:MAG: XrtA-associated tyrosine autokinase [Motiliproteus sp.]